MFAQSIYPAEKVGTSTHFFDSLRELKKLVQKPTPAKIAELSIAVVLTGALTGLGFATLAARYIMRKTNCTFLQRYI